MLSNDPINAGLKPNWAFVDGCIDSAKTRGTCHLYCKNILWREDSRYIWKYIKVENSTALLSIWLGTQFTKHYGHIEDWNEEEKNGYHLSEQYLQYQGFQDLIPTVLKKRLSDYVVICVCMCVCVCVRFFTKHLEKIPFIIRL